MSLISTGIKCLLNLFGTSILYVLPVKFHVPGQDLPRRTKEKENAKGKAQINDFACILVFLYLILASGHMRLALAAAPRVFKDVLDGH